MEKECADLPCQVLGCRKCGRRSATFYSDGYHEQVTMIDVACGVGSSRQYTTPLPRAAQSKYLSREYNNSHSFQMDDIKRRSCDNGLVQRCRKRLPIHSLVARSRTVPSGATLHTAGTRMDVIKRRSRVCRLRRGRVRQRRKR